MYSVKLVFDPPVPTQSLKESLVFCASVELYLRGIPSTQTSASVLCFSSNRDLTLALLLLSASSRFTAVVVEG